MRITVINDADTSIRSNDAIASSSGKIGTADFDVRAGKARRAPTEPRGASMAPREPHTPKGCRNADAPALRAHLDATTALVTQGEGSSRVSAASFVVTATLTKADCPQVNPESKAKVAADVEAASGDLVASLIVLYEKVSMLLKTPGSAETQASVQASTIFVAADGTRPKRTSLSKLAVDARAKFWECIGKARTPAGSPSPSVINTWQDWAPALTPAVRKLTDNELAVLRRAISDDATANVLRIVAPREHEAPAQVLRYNLKAVTDEEAGRRCQVGAAKTA
jgi:hypothetical protein